MKLKVTFIIFVLLAALVINTSCEKIKTLGDSDIAAKKILLSWTASPEKPVNSSGGGYYVYVGDSPSMTENTAKLTFTVPYVSGTQAPTTKLIYGLKPGSYYFKVKAYSGLANLSGTQATSSLSAAAAFTVVGP